LLCSTWVRGAPHCSLLKSGEAEQMGAQLRAEAKPRPSLLGPRLRLGLGEAHRPLPLAVRSGAMKCRLLLGWINERKYKKQ